MRKLLLGLFASLAIASPFAIVSPSVANEKVSKAPTISVSQGIVSALRFYSEYKDAKALDILNFIRKNPNLTKGELELIDLTRLTIYRQEGNNLVNSDLPRSFRERGIQYLTEAIVLDDTSAHARRRRGDGYCRTGNFEYCKRDYAKAWELSKEKNPETLADLLSNRGVAYQEAGRIQEGNEDLRESGRLYRLIGNPRLAEIYEGFIK